MQKKTVLAGMLAIILLGLASSGYFLFAGRFVNVDIIISQGSGINKVSQMIYQNHLSGNKIVPYAILGIGKVLRKNIKYGEYKFSGHYNLYKVLKKLYNGEVAISYITIPEGFTTAQVFEMVNNNQKLFGKITVLEKDGILLPETYDYTYGDNRNTLILRMVKAQQEFIAKNNISNKLGLAPTQVVNFASIVQKEATNDQEMPTVASVFYNRMKIKMPLQADPTVIYAITKGKGPLGRSLTKKDLEMDSPYNTYKAVGLPPTPICNPGKSAILAALNPADTKYLYFVVNEHGNGHNFAPDLGTHNNNVKKYRKFQSR